MSQISDETRRPPVIGISACIFHADPERTTFNGRPLLYLEQSMSSWLMEARAIPLMVPAPPRRRRVSTSLRDIVDALDGLVLQGGVDMSPASYGEEPLRPEWSGDAVRDAYEMELVRLCIERNIPVLGICRGHQVVNVTLGGTLYQDITEQVEGALVHRDAGMYELNFHDVLVEPGSYFQSIYGGELERATINSVHHQAVHELAPDLVVEGRCAADEIIEIIRLPCDGPDDPWVLGVQWHPEFQEPDRDTELLDRAPLLDAFLEACRRRMFE